MNDTFIVGTFQSDNTSPRKIEMPDYAQKENSCGAYSLAYVSKLAANDRSQPTDADWHRLVVGADFAADQNKPAGGLYDAVMFKPVEGTESFPLKLGIDLAMKQLTGAKNCNPVKVVENFSVPGWKAQLCVEPNAKRVVLDHFERCARNDSTADEAAAKKAASSSPLKYIEPCKACAECHSCLPTVV